MNLRNTAIGGAFMVLGAALIVFAMPLETPRHIPYGPDLFPNIVGIGMIVFGLVAAIRAWRGADAAPGLRGERRFGLPVVAFLAVPLLFVAAAPALGYLIIMPLLLGGLIGLMRGRWISSLLIGTAIALALQVLFQQLMRVPLPWGLLEPYAGVLTWM
ncbi:tripartite tricarboxylate transporter TctB family protein [Nitratireductor sp. GCM10026969]|uniref:tripartite tricarboxylate transporter TctB family protein n=1 Tax=Nitratireductor sp. GCM10026969 TaxID=3252645 RepID=UPI0036125B16